MKNKLGFKIWLYLIAFSVAILLLLWCFQILSLKDYYEFSTKKEISKTVEKVKKLYNDPNYADYFDKLSYDNDMCIELYDGIVRVYSSFSCTSTAIEFSREKKAFIKSDTTSQGYEVSNGLDDKVLLYGIELDDNKYAFIQASLIPVDSTVSILKKQLLFVSFFTCVLSVLVAYFISRKISKPIEDINDNAKKLSKGIYDVKFDENSTVQEINELNKTLNYTSSELAKTENLRRELLANVSHDLKTPLTMIKAYAEMVRDLTYNNKEKRESNLNVIITESDRLNLLVNDILDLSKYQSGSIKLEYETFDLVPFIKEITKRYDIYEEKNGYDITCKCKGHIYVNADKKRLEQVMYNLINNAINYTGDDKKVYVFVREENDKVRVEVKDTGKGIKEEDLPLIWDKYYKADKTYSRITVGTGIGLSIVKNILMLHKLNYGVESTVNEGTTFYFELQVVKKPE